MKTPDKAKKQLTVDGTFLTPYARGTVHKGHRKAVDIYDHLTFHFNGYEKAWGAESLINVSVNGLTRRENPYFAKLIDSLRPSENVQIKAYRRDIYLAITKATCFKIYNSLKKIVKSSDWKIDYSKTEKAKTIVEGEELEDYCEENFPIYGSIENWVYSYGLRQMLIDPNGLVVVLPRSWETGEVEYLKPYPYIINSNRVLDITDDFVVYLSDKLNTFTDNNGVDREGKIIMVVTKESIFECKEEKEGGYNIEEHPHGFGSLPAWVMGGTILREQNNVPVYESFISPILPSLDAAARESSDLDAEVVQHIFSTMWYFSGQECPDCRGVGSVMKNGKQSICATCEGNGALKKSPYKDIAVKPPDAIEGKSSIPTPPAGYIIKPTDIVRIQDERIQNHLFRALSAINMEFLASTPLNQSGVAKEIDRDELNNFVYSVAYHLVENILGPIYYFTNEWRNKEVVTDEKLRKEMLPTLTVPEKFNLLTENIIQEQIKAARDAGVSDDIISYLELDFINKKFSNYPDLRDRLVAMKKLDPLASKTNEEISNGLLTDTILKFDVIRSNYIESFIERAIEEDEEFLDLDCYDQQEIIDKFTEEKIVELDGAKTDKQGATQTEDPNNKGFDLLGNPMKVAPVEDSANLGFDTEGNPMPQVENPKNVGFDMKGAPMKPVAPKKKQFGKRPIFFRKKY